ncbi:MAG: hypothetical protein PHU12_00980 [Candidatus Aenigmarchaeota archaeon]|nr:hypothetical protein [Candidatus Aenigmarchaeota archaeon]
MADHSKKKDGILLGHYHRFCMDYKGGNCRSGGICEGMCANWKTFNDVIREELITHIPKPADFYNLVKEKTTIYNQPPTGNSFTVTIPQVQECLSNFEDK